MTRKDRIPHGREGQPVHVSQDIPDFPFADYVRMLGLDGVRVDAVDQIRRACEQATGAEDDAPTIMRQAIKGKWQELVNR